MTLKHEPGKPLDPYAVAQYMKVWADPTQVRDFLAVLVAELTTQVRTTQHSEEPEEVML